MGRGYSPFGQKNFEYTPLMILEKYTPLGGARRRRHFWAKIRKLTLI